MKNNLSNRFKTIWGTLKKNLYLEKQAIFWIRIVVSKIK